MSAVKYSKALSLDHKNRLQKRLDLRPSDGFIARIKLVNNTYFRASVYDLSPKGVSLNIPSEIDIELIVGNKFKIELMHNGFVICELTLKLMWCVHQEKNKRCGFQVLSQYEFMQMPDKSIVVPPYVHIGGYLYKPYMYYERSHFILRKISHYLWQIDIFDTELICFPGLKYELFVNKSGSTSKVDVKVVSVVDVNNNCLSVIVEPSRLNQELGSWIGRELIFCGDFSPEIVRTVGISIKEVSNGFKFRYIKTIEDYEQVLKLRFKAYKAAGKVRADFTFKDMVAPLDNISRILAAYHGEKIVASIVISFPETEETILDTERPFVTGYTKKMPKKTESIEIARLCTDPDYRKTDLLARVFEYTYKTLHCGERRYIITSTDDKLWSLYKKLGFRKTGMSYAHPYLAGIQHHVIVGSSEVPDQATKINFLAWNYLWRDMHSHLDRLGYLNNRITTRLMIKFYIFVGYLLKINLKKKY